MKQYKGRPSDEVVMEKRATRMAKRDEQPAEIKALLEDYSWALVEAYLALGVTKARHIRHLVETTLNELSPVRGTFSSQGPTVARHQKTRAHQDSA